MLGASAVFGGSKRKKCLDSCLKRFEVRNGFLTEEKKGLTTTSAGNLNILGLEREVLKIKTFIRLSS